MKSSETLCYMVRVVLKFKVLEKKLVREGEKSILCVEIVLVFEGRTAQFQSTQK